MVAKQDDVPEAFVPYAELNICSNTLLDGVAPFVIGDVLPLLVGKGNNPLLWLAAPAGESGAEWIELIVASQAVHPAVTIQTDEKTKELTVAFGQHRLLSIFSNTNLATIRFLDLRPIGLDLHGDDKVLYLGSSSFSDNSFQSKFMIKLG